MLYFTTMESISDGATIRIGLKEYYERDNPCDVKFTVPTYSLKIDKKLIFCASGGGSDLFQTYREAAEMIADKMPKERLSDYVLYNGERIRFTTKKWVSCQNVRNDVEKIFRESLENMLGLERGTIRSI